MLARVECHPATARLVYNDQQKAFFLWGSGGDRSSEVHSQCFVAWANAHLFHPRAHARISFLWLQLRRCCHGKGLSRKDAGTGLVLKPTTEWRVIRSTGIIHTKCRAQAAKTLLGPAARQPHVKLLFNLLLASIACSGNESAAASAR